MSVSTACCFIKSLDAERCAVAPVQGVLSKGVLPIIVLARIQWLHRHTVLLSSPSPSLTRYRTGSHPRRILLHHDCILAKVRKFSKGEIIVSAKAPSSFPIVFSRYHRITPSLYSRRTAHIHFYAYHSLKYGGRSGGQWAAVRADGGYGRGPSASTGPHRLNHAPNLCNPWAQQAARPTKRRNSMRMEVE